MLHITTSGRHMDLSEKLKSYAGEKTSKLERYYDRVQSAEIVFDKETGTHHCEIVVTADHHTTFVARESDDDPYAALDAAVKDLERQLTRHKERYRNRKHSGGGDREPLAGPGAEGSSP